MLLVMRGSQSTECAGGLAPVVNFPTACSVAWEIRIPTAAVASLSLLILLLYIAFTLFSAKYF